MSDKDKIQEEEELDEDPVTIIALPIPILRVDLP